MVIVGCRLDEPMFPRCKQEDKLSDVLESKFSRAISAIFRGNFSSPPRTGGRLPWHDTMRSTCTVWGNRSTVALMQNAVDLRSVFVQHTHRHHNRQSELFKRWMCSYSQGIPRISFRTGWGAAEKPSVHQNQTSRLLTIDTDIDTDDVRVRS